MLQVIPPSLSNTVVNIGALQENDANLIAVLSSGISSGNSSGFSIGGSDLSGVSLNGSGLNFNQTGPETYEGRIFDISLSKFAGGSPPLEKRLEIDGPHFDAGPLYSVISRTATSISSAFNPDYLRAQYSNENWNFIGSEGNDTFNPASIFTLVGNDVFEGLGCDDIINGGLGTDWVDGGTGDDTLEGGSGNDTLVGGTGRDRLSGSDGDDVLWAADVQAALPRAQADQVFRLYQATLDRAPEFAGYTSWIDALTVDARDLLDVASGFVDSREFQQTYGPLDDTVFVTQLYRNVLNRDPDAAGLAGWVGAKETGAARAQVVTGFVDSPEFIRQTAGAAQEFAGRIDPASWIDDVYRLYVATLHRAPDLGGLTSWTDILADGTTLSSVARGFVDSPEFSTTYGDLDDADFVELLYQNVPGRASDAVGRAGWLDALEQGAARQDIVLGFSQSNEFVSGTAQAMAAWVTEQPFGNILDGGADDDVLIGGRWSDHFVFQRDGGADRVDDLQTWDLIDLTDMAYSDANAALALMAQDGSDVVFRDQGTPDYVYRYGARADPCGYDLGLIQKTRVYVLNKKCSTSPSLTVYALPSARIFPASLAGPSPPSATKSS